MLINSYKRTLLFGLLLSIGVTGCQKDTPAETEFIRPIKAVQIGSAAQIVDTNFPGVAKATQEVELSFRVSGALQKMPIKIGQEVRVGDVLAELDKRDFNVAVDDAKANLARVDAELKNSKVEYNRVVGMQKKSPGVVSQSVIDQRLTAFNSAKAAFSSATAQLNSAEDRLSYATLKAPFDGVLVQRYAENYQDIIANKPIFRIVDMSKIEMDISIPENLIANLPYVKNQRVTFTAFPEIEIPAQIKEVSNEASLSTRTYHIRLIMTPPSGTDILPGMSGYASADVLLPGQENHVVIPLTAVFSSSDSQTTYAWLYNPESQMVNKIAIEKNKITDQGIVITSGLKSGDWIATAGVNFLTEGQKVRLLTDGANQ